MRVGLLYSVAESLSHLFSTVKRLAHAVALVSILLTQCLLVLSELHSRSRKLKVMTPSRIAVQQGNASVLQKGTV
jgi:hypothetical protein